MRLQEGLHSLLQTADRAVLTQRQSIDEADEVGERRFQRARPSDLHDRAGLPVLEGCQVSRTDRADSCNPCFFGAETVLLLLMVMGRLLPPIARR